MPPRPPTSPPKTPMATAMATTAMAATTPLALLGKDLTSLPMEGARCLITP